MFWIIPILLFVFSIFICIRNSMVYSFRNTINITDRIIYKKLPSYEKMLFSLKPLKEKYWI